MQTYTGPISPSKSPPKSPPVTPPKAPSKSAPKSAPKSPPKSPPVTPSRWNCNHEPDRLTRLDHHCGYFKPNYLEKNPNFPSKCCGEDCGKKFVDKPKGKVAEGEYKVASKTPVHVCLNAANSRHDFCVFAYCNDCLKKALEKVVCQGVKRGQDETALDEASRKSKRRRKHNKKRQYGII